MKRFDQQILVGFNLIFGFNTCLKLISFPTLFCSSFSLKKKKKTVLMINEGVAAFSEILFIPFKFCCYNYKLFIVHRKNCNCSNLC